MDRKLTFLQAIRLQISKSVEIVGNRFEHPQPGFLSEVGVGAGLQRWRLADNRFLSIEAGFLNLNPVVYETYSPVVYTFQGGNQICYNEIKTIAWCAKNYRIKARKYLT
jgi:hypothetical protein